jgi:hypothetical protein
MQLISLIATAITLAASVLGQTGVGDKCTADGLSGICENIDTYTCEGWFVAGHCPGPKNVSPVQ